MSTAPAGLQIATAATPAATGDWVDVEVPAGEAAVFVRAGARVAARFSADAATAHTEVP